MTTRSYRSAGFLQARTYSPRVRYKPREKAVVSRSIGVISSMKGMGRGRQRMAERKTILSRRRNSYRFFDTGWRAGWLAISCQSACPGKGGPFIRNRLKAQINKPCRRRFILHITSRSSREAKLSRFSVIPIRNRECLTCVVPGIIFWPDSYTLYAINNEDATDLLV